MNIITWTIEEMQSMIGKKVNKISDRPFKSTFKVNTVKGVIEHPILKGKYAFTFIEDDSYVLVTRCTKAIQK